MKLLIRAALLILVGILAWDIQHAGLRDSVTATAVLALAERTADASKQLPDVMEKAVQILHDYLDEPPETPDGWLSPLPEEAARSITDLSAETTWAMRLASARTGISLPYLINTARLEANFNPQAKSRTSTAVGLFQIIAPTWLTLMSTYGADYGWRGYATDISCTAKPSICSTKDDQARREILDLRLDSMTATFLAAELARANKKRLQDELGEVPSDYELYIAHLLGARGALTFLKTLESKPETKANTLFPAAANANKPLFYRSNGMAFSCREFDGNLKARWEASIRALNAETLAGKGSKLTSDAQGEGVALAAQAG